MKNIFLSMAAVLVITVPAAFAGKPAAAVKAPAAKSIALVAIGKMDDAMVTRVLEFSRQSLEMPVRLLPAVAESPGTLDEAAALAFKSAGKNDVCIVALVYPKTDIKDHGIFKSELRTVVVNARALKPADQDMERYGRRLERGTLQGVGMLLGLETCPNPQCVMSAYSSDEMLDAKGRNYCPPCLGLVQKKGMEKGLRLLNSEDVETP